MAYNAADQKNITKVISDLQGWDKKGLLTSKIFVQRGLVWEPQRKSNLIRSVLMNDPIGTLTINLTDKKIRELVDGKQRLDAIFGFINDEYKLSTGTESVIDDEGNTVAIEKKKFTDLPDDLKSRITGYNVIVFQYEDLTHEEKVRAFFNINSGKSIKTADLTRSVIKSRNEFIELAKHPAIAELLDDAQKGKLLDEDIIADAYIMLYADNPSLTNKFRNDFLIKEELTEEQRNEICAALDYIQELMEDCKEEKKLIHKFKIKTHLTSLIYIGVLAHRKGITSEQFIEKAKTFFTTEDNSGTISGKYNEACGAGTAGSGKVQTRMNELEKAFLGDGKLLNKVD